MFEPSAPSRPNSPTTSCETSCLGKLAGSAWADQQFRPVHVHRRREGVAGRNDNTPDVKSYCGSERPIG
eukprot:1489184-Alexandrium_andersonii.AAC.1